jgi:xanthine dehydrogenase YagT iron-sulfur-binding subunit
VKPTNEPDNRRNTPVGEEPARGAFSRRGFIRGLGLGSGAVGAGLLEPEVAEAQAAPVTAGPGEVPITLKINGTIKKLSVEPRVTLLDALRNHLDMTGAKRVCDRGTCGACTVIKDGKAVYACGILAIDAQGSDIQTVEGLSTISKPHPVQEAFVNNDAQQCGFCTPGFVMATKALLDHNPNPNMEQVKQGLGGNLCRCGTYVGLRHAALEAAKTMKGGRNA